MLHMIFSSVQFSRIRLFGTPWTAARQASLSISNSWNLLKLMSIESVMPYNHLTLCHPLLLPPSFFPSIRVFSNESTLHMRWPKYWSFSFSVSPSNEHPGLIWSPCCPRDSRESSTITQFKSLYMVHILLKPGLENFEHYFASVRDECYCVAVWAFFGTQLSSKSNSHIHTWLLEKP